MTAPLSIALAKAPALTGLSRSTFYRLFAAGKLTPRKRGRQTIILAHELQAYLDSLPTAKIGGGE